MSTAATSTWERILPTIGVIARLIVGGVLVTAGAIKFPHPQSSVTAVRGYQLLPHKLAEIIGLALPSVEIIVGLALIVGLLTRYAGVLAALMMLAFVIGIVSVWARGIAIDCGCFGGGGEIPEEEAFRQYPREIARDVGFMLLAAFLAWRPQTPFSVDKVVFGQIEETNVEEEP